ncbi:serine hydrolase domain-containing protein [Corynebacterium crudilactis]|uniref:Serine hydrolase n=1 Tax=Corynebacterium crudilactis TaxID=1652495 RepID=A0A172QQU9_9CORY|nr:serine hydrolase domain-containing protein [Corynebacterium crudilactis]ANE03041.1 serine hydrolase [Corynebacterium crudilactis]
MAFDKQQLKRVEDEIQRDIDRGFNDGVNIIVAQGGEIALQGTYGFAERATGRESKRDDVYRILSLSKGFTNGVIYRALSEGKLALSTRVIDIIPEFMGTDPFHMMRKDQINLWNLLTHTSGMPSTPNPGLGPDGFGNLSNVIAALGAVDAVHDPGTQVNYAPSINHALMGEMARRVYGYDHFRDLTNDLIFEPLGMTDTAFGLPAEREDRVVPLKVYVDPEGFLSADDIECLNDVIAGENEMPWVGATTTIDDTFKWVELLRRKGELNGEQLIGKSIIEEAARIQTGDMMNDLYTVVNQGRGWPAPKGNIGLGVVVSGEGHAPNMFGPFVNPAAFGNNGAGSTLYWVDPVNDVTFTFLSSGVLDEADNVERFQRISTMVAAAIV